VQRSKMAVPLRLRKLFARVVRWNCVEQARRLAENAFRASGSKAFCATERFKRRYSRASRATTRPVSSFEPLVAFEPLFARFERLVARFGPLVARFRPVMLLRPF